MESPDNTVNSPMLAPLQPSTPNLTRRPPSVVELSDRENVEINPQSTPCTTRNSFKIFERNWKNQEFCDVTLVTTCGRSVSAHKLVLSAASPVFYNFLKDNPGETEIEVRNPSFETLNGMLQFVYSRKLDAKIDEKAVGDLFLAAHEFKILDLKDVCKEFLRRNLNDNSAIPTWKFCKKLLKQGYEELDDLRIVAEEFIFRTVFKNSN